MNLGAAGEWFTAAELAELALPMLPTTKQGILDRAFKEKWLKRPRQARGGGNEFHIESLPVVAREALEEKRLEEARLKLMPKLTQAEMATAVAATPTTHEVVPLRPSDAPGLSIAKLSDDQRKVMDARLVLLNEIDAITKEIGRKKAVKLFVSAASSNALRPEVQSLVPIANARAGDGGRVLSRATVFNWLKLRAEGGAALAPRARPAMPAPAWAPYFLAYYGQKQKPSMEQACDWLAKSGALPPEIPMPSIHQVKHYVASLPTIRRHIGRKSAKEMKAHKPFVERTTEHQNPLSVVQADGHTADFSVRGPDGTIFRPELTTLLDDKTRKVVGWAAGKKENSLYVLDAVRYCLERHGKIAILYTDNGPGYKNELVDAPVIGLFARLGITHKTSVPYSSQSRGKIERFHQNWIKAGKELATFCGVDMDGDAAKATAKRIKRDIAERGTSRAVLEWPQFMAWAEEKIAEYNNKPHKGLNQRLYDPLTGKTRYLTPNEAWALAVKGGWQPTWLNADEAGSVWRPQEWRNCARCIVQLYNKKYFSEDLAEFDQRRVRVAYDTHDPSRVWVMDEDGRQVAIAVLDGNARPEFPPEEIARAESYRDQKARKRKEGQLKLLDRKADAIRAEGKIAIELSPTTEITPAIEENYREAIAALPKPEERAKTIEELDAELVAEIRAGAAAADRLALFLELAQGESWRDAMGVNNEEVEQIAKKMPPHV